ncbi:hypothetical protein FV228_17210 [Methylobacterium sp. WL18]|nr:hypothetical protein FV228_17210 [Methylobacterium sp. WL18]
MTREAIIEDIKTLKPDVFVSRYIFDRCPAVFSDRHDFIEWKSKLAEKLDVDAASVTLVGSAAIGVSLSPYKDFKLFDKNSDVDVAVVSSYHFNLAWRYLRNNYHNRFKVTSRQRTSWDEHVSKFIYWGTIAADKLLPLMPFAKEWSTASTDASSNPIIADRSVSFRIYSDYEALRSYQVTSVRSLRTSIATRLA